MIRLGFVRLSVMGNLSLLKITFNPLVLTFSENKELKWIGKLLFKVLFDGEHKFELIESRNGTTKFIHSEKLKEFLSH